MTVSGLILRVVFVASWGAFLDGCSTGPKARIERQHGESIVFVGEEPAALAYFPIRGQPFSVRNTYVEDRSIRCVEGLDFVVDYAHGTLQRTSTSRLPDFRKNMLFGQENFDHTKFPGFGNGGYFAFVDYSFAPVATWPIQATQTQFLEVTQAKLKAGQGIRLVAFG